MVEELIIQVHDVYTACTGKVHFQTFDFFRKRPPELTLYADGRILSPNTTWPRFSAGELASSAVQKSKLENNIKDNMLHIHLYIMYVYSHGCCHLKITRIPTCVLSITDSI